MANTIKININKTEVFKRFMQATYKQGEALDQPSVSKQAYNMEADSEIDSDNGLMESSYYKWLWEGVRLISEFVDNPESKSEDDNTEITIIMPSNWAYYSPDAPGLKYAMVELIHNGMLSDWYDSIKQDLSMAFKKKAELNKAEIHSIIYSLRPPTVGINSSYAKFNGED